MVTTNPIYLLAIIAGVCAVAQWSAWKLRLPSILFLLLAGIALGPVSGVLDSDALFGDLLFPFVSIAVAIILFEGGLTLNVSHIRGHGAIVRNLLTLGVVITWALMSVCAHYLFGFEWPLACLFGAIGVVTGPTVIKPLLRTVRPSEKIENVLHWEGILVDPIGAFLAILVFEYIVESSGGGATGEVMWVLVKLVVMGLVLGCIGGKCLALAIGKYLIPDYLKESLTLMGVVVVFAIAESFQHESGLLAVTIMGAWLANEKKLRIDELILFKKHVTVVLISVLFILLAARLQLDAVAQLGWGIVLFLILVQCVIRPLSVWVCTLGSGWSWQEKALLGWIAPRGIVAAAISSLFVIKLESNNVAGAELLVPLAFVLIIGTVVLQSLTAKRVGDYLGVTNLAPNGILVVGANPVSLAIANALRKEEVKVTVADRSARKITQARQSGLSVYHGNPTSGHAEDNLSLAGIGALAAMTQNPETNALAVVHFRSQFGSDRVFALAQNPEQTHEEKKDPTSLRESNSLFSADITYEMLADALQQGASIEVSALDDTASAESQLESISMPLFAIDDAGFTHIYGEGKDFSPEPGWKILHLKERA